jgi:lipoprotein NlpD
VALKGLVFIIILLLQGCFEREAGVALAPVSQGYAKNRISYVVQKGDTLFSIAWKFDKDYKELAYYNRLKDESALKIGQKILLTPPRKIQSKRTIKRVPAKKIAFKRPIAKGSGQYKQTKARYTPMNSNRWYWPVSGRVVEKFSPNKQIKGIDVAGKYGSAVKASQSGVVAYSGNGLRGYGNLVIIRHNNGFLSAYAYNRKIYVKEGQSVKANQKIAEMGNRKGHKGILHFEIRKKGKPVDPLKYLVRH